MFIASGASSVGVDPNKDTIVAVIDGNTCRGSNPSACRAQIVPLRMGGYGAFAAVDPTSADQPRRQRR